MAAQLVPQGSLIVKSGQPLNSLLLITNGTVKLTFPGGEMLLEKGDVIGLLEIYYETHFLTYEAAEEISVIAYPYSNAKPIGNLLAASPDLASLFAISLFKQTCAILDHYEMTKFECTNLYRNLTESYQEYCRLCQQNKISPKALPDLESLEPLVLEDDIEYWLSSYYTAMRKSTSQNVPEFLSRNARVLSGIMLKASQDVQSTLSVCQVLFDYRADSASLLLNENHLDFFDLYTSLLFRLGGSSNAAGAVSAAIGRLMIDLESQSSIDPAFRMYRISEYKDRLQAMEEASEEEDEAAAPRNTESLNASLDKILEYAECEPDVAARFRRLINDFKHLLDKNGTDDKSRKLRQEITKLFYQIYEASLLKSLDDEDIPDIVMMFFQFGYVDEELAGLDNASCLLSAVSSLPSDPEGGVYTIYDWFQAIYTGRKEPSRNEFDTDYTAYIHSMKVSGKISEKQERELLVDQRAKVAFELENMFPLVNKMTFGRITSFCPVFSEHNVLKDLDKTLVKAQDIKENFAAIRALDYSAYARETVYSDPEAGIGRELVFVDITPDVILLPNVGVRGVMWQEIEGKKRSTPARMMVSLFQMEDLSTILIRLTAEFRWEMCRRIQGARWNDLSEHSLTSEYCDYIQFYRRNHDLTPEAKDKIKSALQKAKNSYKEMFVRDYITWILYEGTASPRLNKVARNILFTYCPFTKEVREKLKTNPLYKELLERYQIKLTQKLHHMDNLEQKVKKTGQEIPKILLDERIFIQK